jgi:4-amino-4-deoxy-L-arabinose transferase-like glycosyltransferase
LFNILHFSAWVYALAFFLGLGIVARTKPELTEGFVPYLLPIPLLALFIVWAVRRQRLLSGEERKA